MARRGFRRPIHSALLGALLLQILLTAEILTWSGSTPAVLHDREISVEKTHKQYVYTLFPDDDEQSPDDNVKVRRGMSLSSPPYEPRRDQNTTREKNSKKVHSPTILSTNTNTSRSDEDEPLSLPPNKSNTSKSLVSAVPSYETGVNQSSPTVGRSSPKTRAPEKESQAVHSPTILSTNTSRSDEAEDEPLSLPDAPNKNNTNTSLVSTVPSYETGVNQSSPTILGRSSRERRSLRFPSVQERVKYYLGSWSETCDDYSIRYLRHVDSVQLDISMAGLSNETLVVTPNITSPDGIFFLDFAGIRKIPWSSNGTSVGRLANEIANAVLPVVDLQHWKYDPTAVPILIQRSGATGGKSLPTLSGHRVVQSAIESPCSLNKGPILWNFVDPKRSLKPVENTDIPWEQKIDKAIFRPSLLEVQGNDCTKDPNCNLIKIHHSNGLLDARLVLGRNFGGTVPFGLIPKTIAHNFPARQLFLKYKAIVVPRGGDTSMITWALSSNSIVFMTAPTTTGWTMEDRLEPWVHYVPLLPDLSNVQDRMEWILKNSAQAQEIVRRANTWIDDLFFHKDAEADNIKVVGQLLKRYEAHFQLGTGSSVGQISNEIKKSDIFQAGGRDEEELIRRSLIPITTDVDAVTKTAACYNTIFGAADIHRFMKWAAYNHLLGFDRIFVWYMPGVQNYDGFEKLASLPYVTLIENPKTYVKEVRPGYEYAFGDLNQRALEKVCLQQVAKNYDWVMFADSDEYLWFNETIGVKEFIALQPRNITYLSFGKYMYTRSYGVDIPDSSLGLDMYPFTTGRHCFAKSTHPPDVQDMYLGNPVCPLHWGRSKVIVQPAHHHRVNVHGTHNPDPKLGSIHFHSDFAHFKEWPGIFANVDTSLREPASFSVEQDANLGLHDFQGRGYRTNPDGTYNITFDAHLHDWFEFVVGRSVRSNNKVETSRRG